mmetsp:Transcript_11698/g.20351  ORF Transcript_11698/g.20351 Transcript_11698/m.20351 type:complete len:138 (-) Transcript_11698:363-776(-)
MLWNWSPVQSLSLPCFMEASQRLRIWIDWRRCLKLTCFGSTDDTENIDIGIGNALQDGNTIFISAHDHLYTMSVFSMMAKSSLVAFLCCIVWLECTTRSIDLHRPMKLCDGQQIFEEGMGHALSLYLVCYSLLSPLS